ncbi:MAG TPA: sugar transferase, partial [Desulfuromonadaceae bacterium]|nr:sugar transferase [Desulfuromonadaceae bacterium]
MLRRDRQIRTQIQQLADACIVAVSFWIAYMVRLNPTVSTWFHLELIPPDSLNDVNAIWLCFALLPTALLILESQGYYGRPLIGPRAALLWPLFKGCLLATVALVLAVYAFHVVVPRGVTTFFGVISFLLLYAKEELLRFGVKSRLGQSQYKRRFILVGAHKELHRIRRELEGRRDDSVAIAAQFDLAHPLPQLVQLLHEHSAYGVILSAKHTYFEQVENVIKACELEGVEVWLLADFFTNQISRTTIDELMGRPLLVFSSTPEASWQGILKQVIDFFGAFFLLILLTFVIPVIPVIAVMIKLTSKGPVFFKQQRSGINGAPFTLYKFRTMVTNAEQFKHELEAMNEMKGPVFKVTNDPRITTVGRWLRRYSLDELPQLWNVLWSDMSLVGPRPLPVDEVKRFNDMAHRRRLSVKPGLTCLWQISGRNQISDFRDWVRLDLEYI